jgi:hypothetical protein
MPAPAPEPPAATWTVDALGGWHLPLLDDPTFLPLQPLLQRTLLLGLPDRLLGTLLKRSPTAPLALVAVERSPGAGSARVLGLILARRHNRQGTCWQVDHLRVALAAIEGPRSPSRRVVAAALLREAIQRVRGAASWIATASSLDGSRLATLREQGFQPQRTELLWRWQPGGGPAGSVPADLQLRPLTRRNATLLWHLEQTVCPAHLRQLLDRRSEDLIDQSEARGWMLIDASRNEAVAAVRRAGDHPAGGEQVELSVHPGWERLLGPACELLLHRQQSGRAPLWLGSEEGDRVRRAWLEGIGAEPCGEQVLMARSVWRRQEWHPVERASRRIEAVLARLQPGRRPVPTPVGQR